MLDKCFVMTVICMIDTNLLVNIHEFSYHMRTIEGESAVTIHSYEFTNTQMGLTGFTFNEYGTFYSV